MPWPFRIRLVLFENEAYSGSGCVFCSWSCGSMLTSPVPDRVPISNAATNWIPRSHGYG